MAASTPQPSIDLSHHLSELSKNRHLSPLKGLQKYWGQPNMISLAGGMPDPAYFPFANVTADVLVKDSFPSTKPTESLLARLFRSLFLGGGASKREEKTNAVSVPKYPAKPGDPSLSQALQYSAATGMPQMAELFRELTKKIYKPGYTDWTVLISIGNTDGIFRSLSMLLNPSDAFLVEEWVYPSTLSAVNPFNNKPIAIKVDAEGLSAVDLERVLREWDEKKEGTRRPHVLYTVPIGQNPTGATMGAVRKQAVYDVCVKYDIIIVEDDPYYFLQEGQWEPKAERLARQSAVAVEDDTKVFLDSLSPSFLRFDTQGRVIRLDSFSKVIAPGSRMGWMTCNPLFAERLERQGETTTQAPNGLSQALIFQLLTNHWGFENYVRWLQGLRTQYTIRRDILIDAIFDAFDLQPAAPEHVAGFCASSAGWLTAYPKASRDEKGFTIFSEKRQARTPLFSFVPPSAGMFVWLKFHVTERVGSLPSTSDDDPTTLDEKIWVDLAEHGLLVAPGFIFGADAAHQPKEGARESVAAFRVSFSMGDDETLRKGVHILAKVLARWT